LPFRVKEVMKRLRGVGVDNQACLPGRAWARRKTIFIGARKPSEGYIENRE
jgi:hypothetical protein